MPIWQAVAEFAVRDSLPRLAISGKRADQVAEALVRTPDHREAGFYEVEHVLAYGASDQPDEAEGAADVLLYEDELHGDALGREAVAVSVVEEALVLGPSFFSMASLSEHLYPSDQVYVSFIDQAGHPASDDGLDDQPVPYAALDDTLLDVQDHVP